MKHLVLGHTGNLGADLLKVLRLNSNDIVTTSSTRYGHRLFFDVIKFNQPDVIWNTIGCGSIAEAEKDLATALDIHAMLPVKLALACPNALIINFSTAFVADPLALKDNTKSCITQTNYQHCKRTLERNCLHIPNMRAIRVTNLYGATRPENSLPGRISSNTISLPINLVTPTPTDALAEKLVEHFELIKNASYPIMHAAPSGRCLVADWGRLIYPTIRNGKIDMSRPISCDIGSFFPWTDWKTLWLQFNERHGNIFNRK